MRGLEVRTSDAGFRVFRIHYSADPEKDPATPKGALWLESEVRGYPGGTKSAKWRQEMEIDWDAAGGDLVFPQLDQYLEQIFVDPFEIPTTWSLFASFDYGHRNPSAFHVHAIDHDGDWWTVWEYYKRGARYRDIAKAIRLCPYFDKLKYPPIADPSIWAMNQQTESGVKSLAQLWAELPKDEAIYFAQGKKGGDITFAEKVNGNMWYVDPKPSQDWKFSPRWRIFKTAPWLKWELAKIRYRDWSGTQQQFHNLKEEIVDRDNHAFDGCYDEQTEILTGLGWKRFADVQRGEPVAILDGDEMRFEEVIETIALDHSGTMLLYEGKSLNFCTTEDHWFYAADHLSSVVQKNPKFRRLRFRDFQRNMWVRRTAEYAGKEIDERINGVSADDAIAWYGFWLAEGCKSTNHRGSYYAHVDQKNPDMELIGLMDRLGCKTRRKDRNGVVRFSLGVKWYRLVRNQGISPTKFVPEWLKNLSKRQTEILLHWLWKGDGCGSRYSTSSRRLADDVQELILRIGGAATIGHEAPCLRKLPNGRVVLSREQFYVDRTYGRPGQAGNGERSMLLQIDREKVQRVHYEGKVYCVEVRTGVILVRRKGRAFWCGNSKMFATMFFMSPELPQAEKYEKLKALDYSSYREWKRLDDLERQPRGDGGMGDF